MTDKPQTLNPIVICMGSQSDWPTMQAAKTMLDALDVGCDVQIISAHRTPERLTAFAKTAVKNSIQVIIAGAGGAAHLPGMIAAHTTVPVLGVPVETKTLKGMDSLLSIVQMPWRRSCWHFSHWHCRGKECRAAGSSDSGPVR